MKKTSILIMLLLLCVVLGACVPKDSTDDATPTTYLTNPDISPYTRDPIPWYITRINYGFGTYDEMARAIIENTDWEYNFIHREKESFNQYFGDGYTAFVNTLVQKKSIPIPLSNGKPISLREDKYSGKVELWPISRIGDLSYMHYHLPDSVLLEIHFKEFSSIPELVNATNIWEARRVLNYGNLVAGEYEDYYIDSIDLQLSDQTVQAYVQRSKEENARIYVSFVYDGMWLMVSYSQQFPLTDDFWRAFSIGEYIYQETKQPSREVVTYTKQQYEDYVASNEMPLGFIPYEKLAFFGEMEQWGIPENMQDTIDTYYYSMDIKGEKIDLYVNMLIPPVSGASTMSGDYSLFYDDLSPYRVFQIASENVRYLYMNGCLKYVIFEIDGVSFTIHLKNHTAEDPYEWLCDGSVLLDDFFSGDSYYVEKAYRRFAAAFRGTTTE